MATLLRGFAFALAAMAPVIAVTLLVLVSLPRWRSVGLRALVIALAGGGGGLLLWFAVFHRTQTIAWYPALVTLGAGFTLGGIIMFLWYAARGTFSTDA